ncbi:MAG: EVE domain-containing protein [Leptospiraceae bacterium]|nr:EVE domain-containing protein [Leptospiraceae bacterium]
MAIKEKSFWLFKSEPDVFSIHHLAACKNQTSSWEGVRNYQARNYLRDQAKPGDDILFYHSSVKPLGVFGIATIVKNGYVDHFAFDKKSDYYDPKSKPEKPSWYMVDVKLKSIFKKPVLLEEIKAHSELADMMLLRKGARLSIQPVTKLEFEFILELGKK